MWGLIYSSLASLKKNLIKMLIIILAFTIFIKVINCIVLIEEDNIELIKILLIGTDFVVSLIFYSFCSNLVSNLLNKKWINYVLTCPDAKGRIIKSIYVPYFLISIFLCIFLPLINSICVLMINKNPSSIFLDSFLFSFFTLILFSIELPFIVRFGPTSGAYIKMLFLGLIFLVIVYFACYVPYFTSIEKILDVLFSNSFAKFMKIIKYFIPLIVYLINLLSYFISLKLFSKGVTKL